MLYLDQSQLPVTSGRPSFASSSLHCLADSCKVAVVADVAISRCSPFIHKTAADLAGLSSAVRFLVPNFLNKFLCLANCKCTSLIIGHPESGYWPLSWVMIVLLFEAQENLVHFKLRLFSTGAQVLAQPWCIWMGENRTRISPLFAAVSLLIAGTNLLQIYRILKIMKRKTRRSLKVICALALRCMPLQVFAARALSSMCSRHSPSSLVLQRHPLACLYDPVYGVRIGEMCEWGVLPWSSTDESENRISAALRKMARAVDGAIGCHKAHTWNAAFRSSLVHCLLILILSCSWCSL